MATGQKGYRTNAKMVNKQAQDLHKALSSNDSLHVITKSAIATVAFSLKNGDTFDLGDYLRSENFDIENLVNPAALGFTVTKPRFGQAKKLNDAINKYVKLYAKNSEIFGKGTRDYYQDPATLKTYTEMQIDAQLDIE